MALREIDANIRPEDVNGRSPSSKDALLDIDLLQNALRENLKEIDERIKERTKRLSGDATFADDHTVDEAALLEEDKFWRHEIFTKLQENTDEFTARTLVKKMKNDIVKNSGNSSPARRDADYALQLYEMERAFELATRKRLDNDDESRRLAEKLEEEERQQDGGKK
jgi:hypothetical protein|eukprot:g8255.t1